MLRAVLFDLDDTLFDHRHSSRRALAELQSRVPELESIELDELERTHLRILNELHVGVLSGALTLEAARERRFAELFSHYGIRKVPGMESEVRGSYRKVYRESRRAKPGVIPLLGALRARALKIGIVSNNVLEEQIGKLHACGLTELIDSLTISEEAGVAKPDVRIFQIALERMACAHYEVVMIGDSWTNDILPARQLGMRTIWYNSFGVASPDPSVSCITSFEDTSAVLELILA